MARMNTPDDSAMRHLSRIAHAGNVMAYCRDRVLQGVRAAEAVAGGSSGLAP